MPTTTAPHIWKYRGHPLKKTDEWGLWKDTGRQDWYFLSYRPAGSKGPLVRRFVFTGGPNLTLRDLKQYLLKVRSQLISRKGGFPVHLDVAQARDEYVAELTRRACSDVHIVDVARTIDALAGFSGLTDLTNISLETVERFLAARARRGRSARTQNKYRSHLAAWFTWALHRRYVETNPVTPIAKAKEIRRIKRLPMPDDLLGLVKASSRYDACIWFFLASTGIRRGSFLALDDESFREDGIVISQTKEGAEWFLAYDEGCPLWTPALGTIGRYIIANRGPREGASYLQAHFVRACTDIGKKYTLHSLRHAFCSWLTMMGESMQDVSAWVHHSTVMTTEGWYAHLRPGGKARAEKNRSRVVTMWSQCRDICLAETAAHAQL